MEEINLKDLLDYFISKLYWIISILLVVLLIGVIYLTFIQKPKYEAYTTLVLNRVIDKNNESAALTQTDLLINQKLVSTYREIIKSRPILRETIKLLDLDYTVTTLSNMIEVTSVKDTELIKITVKSKDKEEAASIANSISSVFSNHIKDIYNIENIAIIDKAEIPTNPYNINILKQMVIFILLGFILSFGTIFVIYYFDTSIKDEEDIDKMVELPTLGVIPYVAERRR